MFLPSRLWVNRWTWNHMVQRRFGRVGFLEFLGSFSAARWSFSHSFAVRTGSIWILAGRWEATSSQIVILRQTWREATSGSNLKGCVNNVSQMFRLGLIFLRILVKLFQICFHAIFGLLAAYFEAIFILQLLRNFLKYIF